MKDNKRKQTIIWISARILFSLFVALTVAVKVIDVKEIGPNSSEIGLATVNRAVRDFFGLNMIWYDITDVLGIVAIVVALGFAVLGLCQLIKRRSIKKVDIDIIILGFFYVAVLLIYVFFEICVINYRPCLLEGELEASFPSSHTMLTVCIMSTAIYQAVKKIKNMPLRIVSVVTAGLIMAVTVVGRMISGVHWFTDIVGGLLLSGALILVYIGVCTAVESKLQAKLDKK